MNKITKITFTKEGFEKTKLQYDTLQKQRPAAVEDLKKAREMGDLSENGYYKGARAKLSRIDRELRRLSYFLKNAEVIDSKNVDFIQVGSTVVLKTDSEIVSYSIVGDFEADPLNGKISAKSPIGKELIGKKAGDSIIVKTPSAAKKYTIASFK